MLIHMNVSFAVLAVDTWFWLEEYLATPPQGLFGTEWQECSGRLHVERQMAGFSAFSLCV